MKHESPDDWDGKQDRDCEDEERHSGPTSGLSAGPPWRRSCFEVR